jgi:hypothetical protein
VAVATKLAVLLHHLWVSGEIYEPPRNASRLGGQAAQKDIGAEAAKPKKERR